MIPRDIVIADWHYGPRDSYPSVAVFAEKGFHVLPTSWNKLAEWPPLAANAPLVRAPSDGAGAAPGKK